MSMKKVIAVFSTAFMFVMASASFAANNSDDMNRPDDATITQDVKERLKVNNSGSTIIVETKRGVVILKGDAKSQDEAVEAVQMTESTPGVVDVDTAQLTVENKKMHNNRAFRDALITSKIKGRFLREKVFGEKPIAVWTIAVETRDGVVVLSGTATQEEINNAKKLAKAIKGVKKVESKATVKQ